MNRIKTILAMSAIVSSIGLTGCASRQAGNIRIGDTPAGRIAKDGNIPGKGTYGKCLPYALALHSRLQAAGIPSKVIVYSYETLSSPADLLNGGTRGGVRAGTPGSHAIVAYVDGGRTYIMDNQSWMPRWVRDGSPTGLAVQFSGANIGVLAANVMDGKRCARYANVAGL
jgi:hypothetical protein